MLWRRSTDPLRSSGWSFRTVVDNPPATPANRNEQITHPPVLYVTHVVVLEPTKTRSRHRPLSERATATKQSHRPIHLKAQWHRIPVNRGTLLDVNVTCLTSYKASRTPGVRRYRDSALMPLRSRCRQQSYPSAHSPGTRAGPGDPNDVPIPRISKHLRRYACILAG